MLKCHRFVLKVQRNKEDGFRFFIPTAPETKGTAGTKILKR